MTQPTAPVVTSDGDLEKNTIAAASPDQLTVLVFKDNFTARTFRIPVKWVNQFGWLLAVSFLTAFLCIGIAVQVSVSRATRSHFQSSNQDPQAQLRIHDLETQLKDAQDRIQTLSISNTAAPPAENSDAPVIDPALLSVSSPISSKPFLFRALPDQIQPAPTEVPITLGAPSARWNGRTLAVRFNLQYVSKNPGGQQGRIVILARGPGMVLAHPSQVFQEVGKDVLINPNKGEFFSVSRYRETKADFGPILTHEDIKEVEVLVLSSTGQMLIHEKIIPGQKGAARAAPKTPGSATETQETPSNSNAGDE